MERHNPAARIRRLEAAIGDGPHSRRINTRDHLRGILVILGDRQALELLNARRMRRVA
jgi:hypothetical protein